MGKFRVRYLVEKRQKSHSLWYWQPSKELAAEGWMTRRVAERTNDKADAIKEAEAINAELDASRQGQPPPVIYREGTLPWLIRIYMKSTKYTRLADSTQRGYDQNIKVIEAWSQAAKHPSIVGITPLVIEQFYQSMATTPSKANAVIRTLRLILQYGVKMRVIKENSASRPGLKSTPPRQKVWSDKEIETFIATACNEGRRSMALAVVLGAYIGQRQGDILRLAWSQYDGKSISLRQSKTKRLIDVPVAQVLKAYLDTTPRISTQLVVSETTGQPYKADNFRHLFKEIARKAGLDGLWFLDLRRTAVVRLAEAGCSVPEIAAVSGHELEHTTKILETYLPRSRKMAEHAIAKLEANKKGPNLEG